MAASGREGVVLAARSRFFSLWLSQVARSLADSCLRVFIVLQFLGRGLDGRSAWLVAVPFYVAPFILLAPVNGALTSFPKRWVLSGSTAFCLCVTLLFGLVAGTQVDLWLWCIGLGLVGMGQAVYSSARYAILPAAAYDTGWPNNGVMGLIETGDALGTVAGFFLALSVRDVSWPDAAAGLRCEIPVAVTAAVAFDLVAVLCSLLVRFPSDVPRSEPLTQAVADFFRDSKVIGTDGVASGSLLGLAYFVGVMAAGSGAGFVPAVNLGLAVGYLVAVIQGHPRRMLGLVPPAALGMVAALVWAAAGFDLLWSYLLFGFMGGLILVPLRTLVQLVIPAEVRGNGMALMNAANAFSTLVATLLLSQMIGFGFAATAYHWLLAVAAVVGAIVAWRVLLRETIEQLGEILLWPMYRIRVRGPGRFQIPERGPLLVVANHTAWFDPLWLAKILPRRMTPMMTSKFFDLPILHWLMRNVAGAIRVPIAPFRREAPELQEAVAILDDGGCVLIFPEGSMKRRPEQSLRHFGQGVWRILRQRPGTPVVVCWIEGGWGSYTSYCGGPPAVNKHLDCRRLIQIAVETPEHLDPGLLANHQATRNHLMRACLEARRHLGLQPLSPQLSVAEQDQSEAECDEGTADPA
jgi:1-acyl-sn-glycerol-3-phosphate acyltransferase